MSMEIDPLEYCDLCESPILDYEPGKTTVEVDGISYHRSCYEAEQEREGERAEARDFAAYWGGTASYPFTASERQEEQSRIQRELKR